MTRIVLNNELNIYLTKSGERPFIEWLESLKDKSVRCRVYFSEEGKNLILLLAGCDKSTQDNDIKRAQRYWKEYLLR